MQRHSCQMGKINQKKFFGAIPAVAEQPGEFPSICQNIKQGQRNINHSPKEKQKKSGEIVQNPLQYRILLLVSQSTHSVF